MADVTSLLDATAQAELVRRGEVKPLELVDAAIARIETFAVSHRGVVGGIPLLETSRLEVANTIVAGARAL